MYFVFNQNERRWIQSKKEIKKITSKGGYLWKQARQFYRNHNSE